MMTTHANPTVYLSPNFSDPKITCENIIYSHHKNNKNVFFIVDSFTYIVSQTISSNDNIKIIDINHIAHHVDKDDNLIFIEDLNTLGEVLVPVDEIVCINCWPPFYTTSASKILVFIANVLFIDFSKTYNFISIDNIVEDTENLYNFLQTDVKKNQIIKLPKGHHVFQMNPFNVLESTMSYETVWEIDINPLIANVYFTNYKSNDPRLDFEMFVRHAFLFMSTIARRVQTLNFRPEIIFKKIDATVATQQQQQYTWPIVLKYIYGVIAKQRNALFSQNTKHDPLLQSSIDNTLFTLLGTNIITLHSCAYTNSMLFKSSASSLHTLVLNERAFIQHRSSTVEENKSDKKFILNSLDNILKLLISRFKSTQDTCNISFGSVTNELVGVDISDYYKKLLSSEK